MKKFIKFINKKSDNNPRNDLITREMIVGYHKQVAGNSNLFDNNLLEDRADKILYKYLKKPYSGTKNYGYCPNSYITLIDDILICYKKDINTNTNYVLVIDNKGHELNYDIVKHTINFIHQDAVIVSNLGRIIELDKAEDHFQCKPKEIMITRSFYSIHISSSNKLSR